MRGNGSDSASLGHPRDGTEQALLLCSCPGMSLAQKAFPRNCSMENPCMTLLVFHISALEELNLPEENPLGLWSGDTAEAAPYSRCPGGMRLGRFQTLVRQSSCRYSQIKRIMITDTTLQHRRLWIWTGNALEGDTGLFLVQIPFSESGSPRCP